MNIHQKITAWLSIASGMITLLVLAILFLFFGSVLAFVHLDHSVTAMVAGFGTILGVLFGSFALADILAGVFYLRGSKVAEVCLILFNVLQLFAFPIGTLIGGYSLWAILGSAQQPAPVQSNSVVEA